MKSLNVRLVSCLIAAFSIFCFNQTAYAQAIVSVPSDDGVTLTLNSLSWAIDQVNNNGETIIEFQTDVTLSGSLQTIFNSVDIIGNGHTLNGAGANAMFDIQGGATISNLNFLNAFNPTLGGAINVNGGDLFISGCNFENNIADAGGAIHFGSFGSAIITNCLFAANQASAVQGGGAIVISQGNSVQITSSEFLYNTTSGGNGGAIAYLANGMLLTISKCYFEGNAAPSQRGGAIAADNSGDSEIVNSTFYQNSAGLGGALSFFNTGSAHIVSFSTFVENNVTNDGSIIVSDQPNTIVIRGIIGFNNAGGTEDIIRVGGGGTQFNFNAERSILDRSNTNGYVNGDGNVLFNLEVPFVTDFNISATPTSHGGAGLTFEVDGTDAVNVAPTGITTEDQTGTYRGPGAAYTIGALETNIAPVVTVLQSSFTGFDNSTFSTGAVFSVSDADDDILEVTVSTAFLGAFGNSAGSIEFTGGSASITNNASSSVTLTGSAADINSSLSTMQYTTGLNDAGPRNLTINVTDNWTGYTQGVGVAAGTDSGTSSALIQGTYAITTVADGVSIAGSFRSAFEACIAVRGTNTIDFVTNGVTGTVSLVNHLAPIDFNLTVLGSGRDALIIDGNDTYSLFYVVAGAYQLSMQDLTLRRGVGTDLGGSNGGGGAIYTDVIDQLSLSNMVFELNTPSFATNTNGGAVTSHANTTNISSCLFLNNDAGGGAGWGGAILIGGGNSSLTNNIFDGNSANNSGGAITNYSAGTMTLNHNTFTNNAATSRGDGIYTTGGVISSNYDILFNQGATGDVYNDFGTVNASNCIIGSSLGEPISTTAVTDGSSSFGFGGGYEIGGTEAVNAASSSSEGFDFYGDIRPGNGYNDLGAVEMAPTIVSAMFVDNNGSTDGHVMNQVVLEFSEPVNYASLNPSQFVMNVGSLGSVVDAVTAANGIDVDDFDVYATITISSYPYGTGTTDGVTPVTLEFTGGGATNLAGRDVVAILSITVIDDQNPEVIATYEDVDGNGQVDRVVLDVSEYISAASIDGTVVAGNTLDFDFDTHDISAVATESGSDDDRIIVSLVESGLPDTGVSMNGTLFGTSVIETIGNPLQFLNSSGLDQGPAPIGDAARPVLMNALSTPADDALGVDPNIASVTLVFSENIQNNPSATTEAIILRNHLLDITYGTYDITDVTDPALASASAVVDVSAGSPLPSGTGIAIQFDQFLFEDAAGNTNWAVYDRDSLNFETSGAPTFEAVAYLDTDEDGSIDQIALAFSSMVNFTGNNGAGNDNFDFLSITGGTVTFAPVDLDAAAYDAVSDVYFDITPILGTGDPGLTISYTSAGNTFVSSLGGTEVADGAASTYYDFAAPVVVSVTGNPPIIRESDIGNPFELIVEFSEEMDPLGGDPDITTTGYDPGAPGNELTGFSSSWTNGTYTNSRYVMTSTVTNDLDNDLDVGIQVDPVDIEPDGTFDYPMDIATPEANIMQTTFTDAAAFSISMSIAPPIITDATWNDQDADGNIDQVVLTFEQSVEIADGDAGNGFDAIQINGGAIAIDAANYAASGTLTMTLNFLGDEIVGTGITGLTVSYNTAATNSSIIGTVGSLEMDDATTADVYSDGAAPVLLSSTPADEATNVVVGATIDLVFSEPVSFGTGLITLTDLTNGSLNDTYDVSGPDPELTGGGTSTITITPAASFDNSEQYSIQIAGTAINDGNGNSFAGIADNVTLNFFSESSGPHFTITWLDTNGDGTIDRAEFRFDVQVDILDASNTSGTFDAFTISAPATWVSVNNYDQNNLAAGSPLTVNVANANPGTAVSDFPTVVCDATGDVIIQRDSDNFNMLTGETPTDVIDGAAPVLISSVPVDGATGVPAGDDISLTFSESVIAGTGNIEVVNLDDVSQVQYSVTSASQLSGFGTNTITINPDADLLSFKNYRIRVDATALDDEAASPNSFAGLDNTTNVEFQTSAIVPSYTATWLDANPQDGTIDQLRLDFSTPVNVVDANGATAGFDAISVTGGISITNTNDLSGSGVSSILLELSGTPADNTSNLSETITYSQGSSSIVAVTGGLEIADNDNPTDIFDGADPVLLSSVPANAATDVIVSNNVLLTFSEAIFAGTGSITLTDETDGSNSPSFDVASATEISGFGTATITINPATDLDLTSNYSVQVDATAIEDAETNTYAGIADNTTIAFVTAGNVPTFTVAWLDNGGTGNINQMRLDFSTPVDFTDATPGGTFDALTLSVGSVTTTASVQTNISTFTFDVTGISGTGEQGITVTYNQLLNDNTIVGTGGGLETQDNYTAITYTDEAPPILLSSNPADNSTGFVETADLVLTFSEEIAAGTGNILINDITGVGADNRSIPIGDAQVSISGADLTINPSADLANLNEYAVQVPSTAIVDAATSPNAYAGILNDDDLDFTTKGVSPTITAATWSATAGSPNINRLTLDFSLAVDVTDNDGAGFAAIAISGGAITIDEVDYDALNTTSLTLQVSGAVGTADPGVTVSYVNAATNGTSSDISAVAGLGGEEITNGSVAASYVDAAPPVIISAVTRDSNVNGRIDNVLVTFSEALNDGTSTLGNIDIGTTTYTGEAGVTGTANDNIVRITFTQGLSVDTDATPTVDMAANSFFDASGNTLGTVQNFGIATDGAGPAIIAAVTDDVDGNGAIDQVTVTFSENVDDGSTVASGINVLGAGYSGETETASTLGDAVIVISFTNAGSFDTDARPNIALSTNSVFDALGNTTSALQNFGATTDGAAPVIASAVMESNNNKYIDLTWSEPIYTGSGTPGSGILIADLDPSVTSSVTPVAVFGSITAVTQNDNPDDALATPLVGGETVVRMFFTYSGGSATTDSLVVEAASGTAIVDANGNYMPVPQAGDLNGDNFVVSNIPVMSSAVFQDTNGNGKIDRVRIFFGSFTVTARETNSTKNDDGMSAIEITYNTNLITQVNANYRNVTYSSGTPLVINLDETDPDLPQYTGTTGFQVTYVRDPGGDLIEAGSELDIPSYAPLVDDATPHFPNFTATLLDLNEDGNSDAIRVYAADEINDALLGSGTWTYGGASVTPQTGNSTSDATFILSFTGGVGTAVDASRDLRFEASPAGVLTDNGGKTLTGANQTIAGSSVLDEADPVIISATTIDSEPNGIIDQMEIVFSETISDPTGSHANFVVGGETADGSISFDGAATYVISFPNGGNTTQTPNIYLAASTVTDVSSNANPNPLINTFNGTDDGAGAFVQLDDQDGSAPYDNYPKVYTSLTPTINGYIDDPSAIILVNVGGSGVLGTNLGDGTWTANVTLADAITYDVAITALDAAGNVSNDQTLNEIIINGGITITAPDQPDVCIDADFIDLGTLILSENNVQDMRTGGSMLLQLPPDFIFNTAATVTTTNYDDAVSPDGSDVTVTHSYLGNSILVLGFTIPSTTALDSIRVEGLQVKGTGSISSGNMTIFTSSASIFGQGGAGDKVYASMTSNYTASAPTGMDVSTAVENAVNVVQFGTPLGQNFTIDMSSYITESTVNWYDDTPSLVYSGGATATQTNLASGIDINTVGIYPMEVAQSDATCESNSLLFNVLVYDDTDPFEGGNSFISRFYNDTQPADTIYLSNPIGYSVDISSNAPAGFSIVDILADPIKVVFDPAAATQGTYTMTYIVENDVTGKSVTVTRTLEVVPSPPLFTGIFADVYCNDDPMVSLQLTNSFDPTWGNNPSLLGLQADGRRFNRSGLISTESASLYGEDLHNGTNLFVGIGYPKIITAPYTFKFQPDTLAVGPGEYEIVRFATKIKDDNGFTRLGAEDYFVVYGVPDLNITNIADNETYCAGDPSFTISRYLSYVENMDLANPAFPVATFNTDVNTTISEGYRIYKSNDNGVTYDGYGGAPGTVWADFTGTRNIFNPEDPDNNGSTYLDGDLDDIGYFLIEYTPGQLGPNNCETIVTKAIRIFDQPAPLTFTSTDITAVGGNVYNDSENSYVVEVCVGSYLPYLGVDGNAASDATPGVDMVYTGIGAGPLTAGTPVLFTRGAAYNNGGFYYGYGYINTDNGTAFTFQSTYIFQTGYSLQAGDYISYYDGFNWVEYGVIDNFGLPLANVKWYKGAGLAEELTAYENNALLPTSSFVSNDNGVISAATNTVLFYTTTSADGCVSDPVRIVFRAYSVANAPTLNLASTGFTVADVRTGSATTGYEYKLDYCTDTNGGTATPDNLRLPFLGPGQEYNIVQYFNADFINDPLNYVVGTTTNYNNTTFGGAGHNISGDVIAGGQSYRYDVYLRDNINSTSGFTGCDSYLTTVYTYGYDLPADVSEADFTLNTLNFHVSEGAALVGGISHSFIDNINEYTWYGDAGALDLIETLTSGAMTQSSLNGLVDASNDRLLLTGGLIDDRFNDGVNDTLTYYVERRGGIQDARNFDGCVSGLTAINLIVHAKQEKPTIVSDNSAILGKPNFIDLAGPGVDGDWGDHYFAVCLDQTDALAELDASALFTSSVQPEGSQYFRWYSINFGKTRNSQIPLFEGSDAPFSSLGLDVLVAGDHYFEVVQVTDSTTYSIGNLYGGIEGEKTYVHVAIVENEDLTFTVINDLNESLFVNYTATDFTNQTVYSSLLDLIPANNTICIDDLGTNGLGDIELDPSVTTLGINPADVDPTRLSYQITSYGFDNLSDPDTTVFPIKFGLPILDIDSLHSIADLIVDDDTVGGRNSIHLIELFYTQPTGECQVVNSTYIAIAPKPSITFTVNGIDITDPDFDVLYNAFCYSTTTLELQGYNEFGVRVVNGDFSGNGVESSSNIGNAKFRPSAAHLKYWEEDPTVGLGVGNLAYDIEYYDQSSHIIRFDYTDVDGCSNFIEKEIFVNPLPYIVGATGDQIIYDAICREYQIEAHADLYVPPTSNDPLALVTDFSDYTFTWTSSTAGNTTIVSTAGTNNVVFNSGIGNGGYTDNSFNMSLTVSTALNCGVSISEQDVQNYAPIPTITYVGLTENGIDGLELFLHEEEPSLANANVDSTQIVIYGPAAAPTTMSPVAVDMTVYSPNIYQPVNINTLTAGNYLVVATMYSQGGCVVSNADQRIITILDNIYLDPLSLSDYLATFDAATVGDPYTISGDNSLSDKWYIEKSIANGKADTLKTSWTFGASGSNRTFSGIDFETGSIVPGNFILTNTVNPTTLNNEYGQNEKSYVYSPAFDLTDFNNPALSFNRVVDFDNLRDGVILQVSYDDGRNWRVLGDFDLTSGINWYNNQGVSSGPGEGGRAPEVGTSHVEQVAFTGDDVDINGTAYWRESRHRIGKSSDNLTPGDSLTRFRFALATTGGSKGGKGGYAFDNFKIFEINKIVLVEQFSSSLDGESRRYMEDLIIDPSVTITAGTPTPIDWEAGTEGLLMNYHTDFLNAADVDYINSLNRVDPSTRATYYGLLDAPATRIGGYHYEYDIDTNPQDFYNGFDVTALDEEEFSVTFTSSNFDINTGDISATVDFVPQGDITQDEVLFFVAVVEKSTPTGAGAVYPTAYHVVRKLLPTAGGDFVRGIFSQTPGAGVIDNHQMNVQWNIGNVLSNSYAITDGIRLVAFAQDYKTGEILQANFVDLTVDAPLVTGIEDLLGIGYTLYPNPADNLVNLEFGEAPENDVYWKISDQSGREVLSGKVNRGSKLPEPIDTSKLPSGLYIIQLHNEERTWMPRKVLITH